MNKKLVLVSLLVLVVFLVGCQQVAEEAMEKNIEVETGGDAEVDISEGNVKIETEEGTMEIESSGMNSDEWCQEGAEWKFKSTL